MPRVIRRQSAIQRLMSRLNPFDYALELSTEYEALDWDSMNETYGGYIGFGLNIICMFTRAYTGATKRYDDDVFARPIKSSGLASGFSYLISVLSIGVALLSLGNTIYCFGNKKRYRLFEQDVGVEPPTPSARLVHADSSPTTNSPMRVFKSISSALSDDPASRAHPDERTDVWEVGVWDPTALSLRLFTMLSPVHVAVYWLSLPVQTSTTYVNSPLRGAMPNGVSPATVFFTVILTQVILTLQLSQMASAFRQQAIDHRILNKQVLNEYNKKYVHARLNVLKRDVAIQTADDSTGDPGSVVFSTPQYNRLGFRTNPNPNYAAFTDMGGYRSTGYETAPSSINHTTFGKSRAESIPEITSPRGKMRGPQFDRLGARSNGTPSVPRRSVVASVVSSSGMQAGSEDEEMYETPTRTSRAVSQRRTPSRDVARATAATPILNTNNKNIGVNGLVNWSIENSRNLSPSKMPTSSGRRGPTPSSYGSSLGTSMATPRRRQQI